MRTRWSVIALISIVTVSIVAVLLASSGPRLRSINFDKSSVVTESGARIILHFNQPLQEVSEVTISPLVEFSYTTNQTLVVIELKQPLKYDTRYDISGIATADGQKSADFSTRFSTRDILTYHLQRVPDSNDMVVSTRAFEPSNTVLTNTEIDEFAISDQDVIHTVPYGISHSLSIGDESFIDPNMYQIEQLSVSRNGAYLGYLSGSIEAGEEYLTRNIKLFDLDIQIEFEPFKTLPKTTDIGEWLFTPDSESIVVISSSGDIVLLPVSEGDELPLGSASSLDGITADGRVLFVQDQSGVKRLNIETLDRTIINSPIMFAGFSPQVIRAVPSYTDAETMYIYSTVQKSAMYENKITIHNKSQERELYSSSLTSESIINFYPSKNDQFLFVETSESSSARYGGYKGLDRPSNIRINVVEVETGTIVAVFDGFNIKEL